MPNGGSDCCGTCWFNNKNHGKPGYHGLGKVYCTIRDLEIPNPLWTYCVNHPQHNADKIDIPLGPVFISDGYPYTRKVWKDPPDTEQIRQGLLDLLNKFAADPHYQFPVDVALEEEAIVQLMVLQEGRAEEGLLNIINFDPEKYKDQEPLIIRNNSIVVGKAIEALLTITGSKYLERIGKFIDIGLSKFNGRSYDAREDGFAAIRYHLVRALEHTNDRRAIHLLEKATKDPHFEVRKFAQQILSNK